MSGMYFSRDQINWFIKGEQGLNENAMVSLLFLNSSSEENGWVTNVCIPALAEVAEYDPRHFYNGIKDLEKKGCITWYGDDIQITHNERRFTKGGKGAFVVPDILLTKRFTRGTMLRAKRLAFYFLSFGLADAANKRYLRTGLQVTRDKLVDISGALGPAHLDFFLDQISWLFDIENNGNKLRIKVNEKYIVTPEVKPFADYIDLAHLKFLVARYKNIKSGAIEAWKSLLNLWSRYGSRLLHKALTEANKRSDIDNLPAYLHGIIKNLCIIENLKFSTVHY